MKGDEGEDVGHEEDEKKEELRIREVGSDICSLNLYLIILSVTVCLTPSIGPVYHSHRSTCHRIVQSEKFPKSLIQ